MYDCAGEVREIINRSNYVCKMVVVIPCPAKVAS